MGINSKACKQCSELNNPNLESCWKCGASFSGNKINNFNEEIERCLTDKNGRIFSVSIKTSPALVDDQGFKSYVARASEKALEDVAIFLKNNPCVKFKRITQSEAEKHQQELQRMGISSVVANELEVFRDHFQKSPNKKRISMKNSTCVACVSPKAIGFKEDYLWDPLLIFAGWLVYLLVLGSRGYSYFCLSCGHQWDK